MHKKLAQMQMLFHCLLIAMITCYIMIKTSVLFHMRRALFCYEYKMLCQGTHKMITIQALGRLSVNKEYFHDTGP